MLIDMLLPQRADLNKSCVFVFSREQVLDISRNLFSGPLVDTDLNALPVLRLLDLSSNELTGSILDFSDNTVLERVDLSQNRLLGSISDKFQNNAMQLDVSENE